MKQNCWHLKKCGREPNGSKASELGVCPAATDQQMNGPNGGIHGGRICWAIAGTLCGGKVQGSYAAKQATCLSCEVYKLVRTEEGSGFKLILRAQSRASA